ncbi:erythromycin esterase family protein [Glycomyces sp. NPDC046736]|uniref:erythromycin esterase family protein n=1 Tax=Glycomyces sp. NPDC046736 TaxID=3155615 RepID=UPI0033D279A1
MIQHLHGHLKHGYDVVGLGEPDHREPAFGLARNDLFALLATSGFRSIALETDRVAAFAVDDYVRNGTGSLDEAMTGFTHGFGEFDANRRLVAWMREYNERCEPSGRLSFHGIDAPLEFTAASPRRYLEHARDYLGLDLDLDPLLGEDEDWSRTEAVTDPSRSLGDTPEARALRATADDLLHRLYAEAPQLIRSTSRAAWHRAKAHLDAALHLLRYHRQAAIPGEEGDRWSRLSAVRDAAMARNLLDIRDLEARRGPTLVHGHNVHLQLEESRMSMAGMALAWHCTGAIVASLLGDRYRFVEGVLGEGGVAEFKL